MPRAAVVAREELKARHQQLPPVIKIETQQLGAVSFAQFQRVGRRRDKGSAVVEVVFPLAREPPTPRRKVQLELVLMQSKASVATPLVPNRPDLQQAQIGDTHFPPATRAGAMLVNPPIPMNALSR
jgi:hypothetical protein